MKKITIIPAILLSLPLIGCNNSSKSIDINDLMVRTKSSSYSAIFFSSETEHSYQDYGFVICDAIQRSYGYDLKPIKKKLNDCDNYLSYQVTLPSGPASDVSWFNLTIRADGYIQSVYGWYKGKLASGDSTYVYKVEESINLKLIDFATTRFEQINKTYNEEKTKALEDAKVENLLKHLEESNEKTLTYYKDGNYVLNDRDNSLLDDIKNINFVYSKDNSSEDSDIVINSLITYTAPDNWSLNINKDLKTAVVNYNYSGAYFAFNVRILYSIDSEEVQALINKVESIVNL